MADQHTSIDFTILDVIENPTVGDTLGEPKMFHLDAPERFEMQATKQANGSFLVQSMVIGDGSTENYFQGTRRIYDPMDKAFNALRHDFVASKGTADTDVQFREIDPNYDAQDPSTYQRWHKLTPDVWSPSTRCIAELTTNLSGSAEGMRRDYDLKVMKYEEYVALAHVNQYFVFVVSPNSVLTNFPVSDNVVKELCMRCRFGLALEAKIIEITGNNPFTSSEMREKEKIVTHVLNSIARSEEEDLDFTHEIVEMGLQPLTEAERTRVYSLIAQQFDATRVLIAHPRSDMLDYVTSFDNNSRAKNDLKRVTNFPFVVSFRGEDSDYVPLSDAYWNDFDNLPDSLQSVWSECFAKNKHIPLSDAEAADVELSARYAKNQPLKHRIQKHHTFKPHLNDKDKLALALVGIGAKEMAGGQHREDMAKKAAYSHLGFHPEADTRDIEDFLHGEHLTRRYVDLEADKMYVTRIFQESKKLYGFDTKILDSVQVFTDYIFKSEIICFADLMSCFMSEIAMCSKILTPPGTFTFKYLRYYRAGFVAKNTGTHIFISYIFDKRTSQEIDTGRMGPTIYDAGQFLVSDWVSYDPQHIEHYMKCGPLMSAVMSHYLSLFKVDVTTVEPDSFFSIFSNQQFWHTLKLTLLTFLNNKTDLEEVITNQRYFLMNILDEINPDPYKFVKRLPEVIRSRLTSYIVKESMILMDYYSVEKVEKTKSIMDGAGLVTASYNNLKSVVCPGILTLEQCIELFYVGYVVTKEKSSGAHNNFAICKKLMREEFKYLKNREEGRRVVTDLDVPADHQSDKTFLKFVTIGLERLLHLKVGPNHKEILLREVTSQMANVTFLDLATLKASARKSQEDIDTDDINPTSFKDAQNKMKEADPESFMSRPKAITALNDLIEDYKSAGNHAPTHIIELIPYCFEKIEGKGGFDSDLFSKSQHGGVREIHVLEMMARILQFFSELINRVYCKHFESEKLTNPGTKDSFIPKHYRDAAIAYEEFLTFCCSGDKKTWCQGNHAVRFATILTGVAHGKLHNFIYRVYLLWVSKKITLPADLIAVFLANDRTPSSDRIFIEMRKRFMTGEEPFLKKGGRVVRIRSGMFQGILHFASSLQHTAVQEVCSVIISDIWTSITGKSMKQTIAQGSDDYGVLYSIPYDKANVVSNVHLLNRLARLRPALAHLTGLTDSDKTAMFVMDVIEFNSIWTVMKAVKAPTLKWAIASMEISLVENFITRFRQFSNSLSQLLEGGASTFECALVQLSQAWMHYKLLGLDGSLHFKGLVEDIIEIPDPNTGFFPLEPDLTCGVTGLDYSLYHLAKRSKFGSLLVSVESLAETDNLDYNHRKSKVLGEQTRSLTISFSDPKKWRSMMKKSGLATYEECIAYFDTHPEVAFGGKSTWEEDRLAIALKMFSPAVRSSLSGKQPILRMMVAAGYLLNRPCFKYRDPFTEGTGFVMMSLLDAIKKKKQDFYSSDYEDRDPEKLKSLFPMWAEYDHFYDVSSELYKTMFFEPASYHKKGRVSLQVYADPTDEKFPLISLCNRKWFAKKYAVRVGEDLFNELWTKVKVKYIFVRDTVDETVKSTGLHVIFLKAYIESTISRGRFLKLFDTAAKGSNIYSALTRIYWDGIKIRSHREAINESSLSDLRSTIFSLLNFFYKNHFANHLVKTLLSTSEFLKQNYSDLPDNARNLKVMRDIITGTMSNELAIQYITERRGGTVGWFSVIQKYSPQVRHRIGRGEWTGLVGRVPVILELEDNIVTRVIVGSLADSDNTTRGLHSLISDFKLLYPEVPRPSKDNIYFPKRGTFSKCLEPMKLSVPVTHEPELKINRFDNVSTTNWEIDSDPFGIKLVNYTSEGLKAVLLSERFSSRDWDKESHWLLDPGTMLHRWHRGEAETISHWAQLSRDIMSENKKNLPLTRYVREMRSKNSPTVYDLVRLQSAFIRFWSGYKMDDRGILQMMEWGQRREKERVTLGDIDLDSLDFLRELRSVEGVVGMNALGGLGDISATLEDKSAQYEMELSGAQFAPSSEELEDIKAMLGKSAQMQDDPEELLDIATSMPLHNRFFNRLNNYLSDTYPNVAISNLIEDDTPFEGDIGGLISLIAGKDKLTHLDSEDYVFPEDSVSQVISYMSGATASSHLTGQRNRVKELAEQLRGLSGFPLMVIQQKLRLETNRLRVMEEGVIEPFGEDAVLLGLRTGEFLIGCYDAVNLRGTGTVRERNALSLNDDAIWLNQVVAELIEFIETSLEMEEIDNEVAQKWVDALKAPYVCVDLASLVASKIAMTIKVTLKRVETYKLAPVTAEGESMGVLEFVLDNKTWV
jgi:hypothetical protein